MFRLSDYIKKAEDKIQGFYEKQKQNLPKILAAAAGILYFYGMAVHGILAGMESITGEYTGEILTWNPFSNLAAVLSPGGLGITAVIALLTFLCSKWGYRKFAKAKYDKERNMELSPEGTHGSSGWLEPKQAREILEIAPVEQLTAPLFGKLPGGYAGMKDTIGLNKNVMLYGSPGTGKSRGFVMPFILQSVRRGESLLLVDSKAEFYEGYSEYLRQEGYLVRAFNLLDLYASDAWNCLMDSAQNPNLVQVIAEIIIRSTSSNAEQNDFWATAEKNLLMALIHYVQSLTYPNSDRLLPTEQRSLGTIYKIISSTSVTELDARFRALPPGHPALPPYGIFRQAPHNIWGNIFIGLGSRLNVFQNQQVDSITKYNEIDLERPGLQKCAYFCIISDQDSSLSFLSSLFFSLLFNRLFDLARNQPNRRLPVCVNVLMDEFCNVYVPDIKRIFGTARSRFINIQAVAQSIAQLADRYPKTEWLELVGDCDYQYFLGCNDTMTAEYISQQCGDITVKTHSASKPLSSSFFSFLSPQSRYSESASTAKRPLITPDEVRRLPKDQAILIIRGEKPLKVQKIVPEEHPDYIKLTPCKATDHIPLWRQQEQEKEQKKEPCASTAQGSETGKEQEPEKHEQEIPPVKIDLSEGFDCRTGKTIEEVSPDEV